MEIRVWISWGCRPAELLVGVEEDAPGDCSQEADAISVFISLLKSDMLAFGENFFKTY